MYVGWYFPVHFSQEESAEKILFVFTNTCIRHILYERLNPIKTQIFPSEMFVVFSSDKTHKLLTWSLKSGSYGSCKSHFGLSFHLDSYIYIYLIYTWIYVTDIFIYISLNTHVSRVTFVKRNLYQACCFHFSILLFITVFLALLLDHRILLF